MNLFSFRHRLRCVSQYLSKPDVAVIGGYHLGNLGDMALGEAMSIGCRGRGLVPGLQTIYNLKRWRPVFPGVVGGGAVTLRDCLAPLLDRYRTSLGALAFCGVDIEDWDAFEEFSPQLKQTAWFSVRSKVQAEKANTLTNTPFVRFHPDIVFSLLPLAQNSAPAPGGRYAVLNTCPRFHVADANAFCKDRQLAEPARYSALRDNFTSFARQLAVRLRSAGLDLVHVPFTPSDTWAAAQIYEGLPVRFLPYSADPTKVLELFAKASFSFASRYHSMIYTLLAGLPGVAVAYADKSARLLGDLDANRARYLSLNDLAGPADPAAKANEIDLSTTIASPAKVAEYARLAAEGVGAAVRSLASGRSEQT